MSTATASRGNVRESAMEIVRDLPEEATWADLLYQIHLREELDAAEADFQAGRVVSHEEIKKEFGLAV